jgi:hypothetical protein
LAHALQCLWDEAAAADKPTNPIEERGAAPRARTDEMELDGCFLIASMSPVALSFLLRINQTQRRQR